MSCESALTEGELAQRWNISAKTLQRWRSENRGPRYYKLSKVVRYALDDIIAYEEAQRQGAPIDADLPPLPSLPSTEETASPAPAKLEPKRYTLREAFELVARFGSLQAAEASLSEVDDESRR